MKGYYGKIIVCLSLVFSMQAIYAQDDLAYNGSPDWPVVVGPSGSEVLANYTDFANSGSVTAVIQVDGSQVGGAGDYIAAFVDGELRGVAPASEIPPIFGNGFGFNLMVYSDVAEGETINFQYYDSASDAVYNLAETIGFESDMIVGSLTGPQVFTLSLIHI